MFPTVLEIGRSKVKVPANIKVLDGELSGESLLHGLQMSDFSLCWSGDWKSKSNLTIGLVSPFFLVCR